MYCIIGSKCGIRLSYQLVPQLLNATMLLNFLKVNVSNSHNTTPPAKDPPNSHTHIHPSIQAYTETKAEAILTSIYIKQSRSKTHKTKQTHYNNAPPKQHPNSTPKNRTVKNILPYRIVSIV